MVSVTKWWKFHPIHFKIWQFPEVFIDETAHVKRNLAFRPMLQSKEHNYLTKEELKFEQQCSRGNSSIAYEERIQGDSYKNTSWLKFVN